MMYKLCKWIYELGYNKGKFDGRNEMADEYNANKFREQLINAPKPTNKKV